MERGALKVINGDARIADTHIQQALGYARIDGLHRLIQRHEDELRDFGEVFRHAAENPAGKGGRPTLTYYLNEHQATAVCLWANTAKARAGRKVIVEVFTAWRKGQLESFAGSAKQDPFARAADRTGNARDQLQALAEMPQLAREITHLPIWKNGRRPPWFSNLELRSFLTECHRQMTLAACSAEAERRFGVRVSASGLQRFWAQLDRATGVVAGQPKRRSA